MSRYMDRARAGDAEAMVHLGRSYFWGWYGVERDYGEALVWYGKAAAKGHSTALFMLGLMHEFGQGTPKNLLNALSYYKQANDKGLDSTMDIARVESAIAEDPALRAAAAAAGAAAAGAAGSAAGGQRPAKKARKEVDEAPDVFAARLEHDSAALDAEKALVQQREDAVKKREAEAKRKETALKRRETLVQKREVAVEQREADVQRRINELEADQRAKESEAAAFSATKRAAAAARQAEILGARRSEKKYAVQLEVIAASWEKTVVDLFHCQPCSRPIAPGQSVLLDQCLHAICRACVPHMLQADNKLICSVCQTVSTLTPTALPHHPLVEAELGSDAAQGCIMCTHLPEEDRMHATVECSSCEPHKVLCDGHGSNHRTRQPTHSIAPLAHGGAAPRCVTHDKPVEAYCATCDALVCLACFASTHPAATHAVKLLTDTAFVGSIRARLVEGVSTARTVAQSLVEYAADAAVAVTELDERDAAIAAEVDRAINVLLGLLERRRVAMHESCAAQSRQERAALQTAREESEYRWRMVSSAADLAEQLAAGTRLRPNATAVLMQLQTAALARLGTAGGLKPAGVPAPSILRFLFDESVAAQLTHLGEIVQDAP